MFSSVSAWIAGLSNVGKLSLAGSAIAGTMLVGSVANPEPAPAAPASQVQESAATTKVEIDTETIPFDSRTVDDGSLAKGEKRVRTVGVDGVKTVTHTITLSDGVETSRISSEEVTLAPVTEVVAVGTYVTPVQQAPSSGGVVKMSRSDICHAPGSTYYSRTKNYTSYDSLQACLNAGGRMPKR